MELLPCGNLRSANLPILLRYLQQHKKTGILILHRNDQERSIYLKNGDIIFATSKYEDDRLGEMLLKENKITLEQYETSVALLKATGKRQGTILVEQGFIDAIDLFNAVIDQFKNIILSLLTWIDGDYRFIEGNLPTEEVIILKMSTGNLILDGIKRIRDWTRLSRQIPAWDSVLQVGLDPKNLFQDILFSSEELQFLKAIDGKRTIRDLFKISTLPPLITLQMIYFLLSVGIVEVLDKTPVDAKSKAPTGQDVEGHAGTDEALLNTVLKEKRENVKDSQEEIFQKLSQERLASREKIRQACEALPHQDHYQVLGLNPDATRDEVRRAYFKLAKEYHPDRHLQEDMGDLREALEALFQRITQAYDTLLVEKTRKEYDLSLAMGAAHKTAAEATLSPEQQAMQQYERAKEAFKKGDMSQVVYCMEWALRLGPEKPGYHALLGQALMTVPGRLKQAEEAFKKAIQLDPANPSYYIHLGKVYKKAGMKNRALSQFQEALKWDASNPQAQEEIKQLKK